MKNNSSDISLNVVEIFKSIQGEGANAGKAAVFVRLAGCNKSCWYCDTNWSVSTKMTVQEVLEQVIELSNPEEYPHHLLIWTGGEPTLQLTDEILRPANPEASRYTSARDILRGVDEIATRLQS